MRRRRHETVSKPTPNTPVALSVDPHTAVDEWRVGGSCRGCRDWDLAGGCVTGQGAARACVLACA